MTGSKLALDANVAIKVLNGDPVVSRWVLSYAEVFLPAAALGELRYGAAKSGRSTANHARVDQLLSACPLLTIDAETCSHYAAVRLHLQQRGTPIPANDVWIAASCLRHDIPIATLDGHLENIPGLASLRPPQDT